MFFQKRPMFFSKQRYIFSTYFNVKNDLLFELGNILKGAASKLAFCEQPLLRCVRISKMQDTEDETGLQLEIYPII